MKVSLGKIEYRCTSPLSRVQVYLATCVFLIRTNQRQSQVAGSSKNVNNRYEMADRLSDVDRFNNFLQILMRCCVKVMRKLLSKLVQTLGYPYVDRFLSKEKTHIQRMSYASSPNIQAILFPDTPTDIEQWDFSLLNCILNLIQRKIIIQEFGNPIDPVLEKNKAQVTSTPKGRAYETTLYPTLGRPTDTNKWSMPVCSCLLSVLSPKPQTLLVTILESLDDIRELRNRICHPKNPAMTSSDYERQMPVLKTFIDEALAYLGDDAVESEVKTEMCDIENGKMKTFLLIDQSHLQQSYDNDRDIIQRLDNIEKAVKDMPSQGELNLLVFFGRLAKEQKELLYASYIETFNECLKSSLPEAEENEELTQRITLASCMAWRILDNPYEGRRVLGVRRKCIEVQIGFDNVVCMWSFIKDFLNGRLESAFEPMQTLLRRQEGFEKLELTVNVPDIFSVLMQIGEAVEMDIGSVMYMLELFSDVSNRRTQTSQEEVQNVSTQTGPIKPDGPEETLVEETDRLVVAKSKTFSEGFSFDEFGKRVMTSTSQEYEKAIEKITIDGPEQQVKPLQMEGSKQPVEECMIDESSGHSLTASEYEKSMTYFSTDTSEINKELVSRFCEPCLQDKIKNQCVVKCKECDEFLCSDCARVHGNMKMTRNHILIAKQSDDLGSLSFIPAPTQDLTRLTFTQAPAISVKSPSDPKDCILTSMLLLPENRLLLTDLGNHKVKLLDLQTNILVSQVSVMPGAPLDMCLLPVDRVAVSLDDGSIRFLKTRELLSLGDSIKVAIDCRGIGYYNDRLIASFSSGKVKMMDMAGEVITMIYRDDSGKPVFSNPRYLIVVLHEYQKAAIYVSDCGKHNITKLDIDLNILQIFHDPALRGPQCITAVGNQLLICGRNSDNIISLELSSDQMTQLLGQKEDIHRPISVCYSQQQKRLYVSDAYGLSELNRPIQVFSGNEQITDSHAS
ncbi:uncharacterized protein LOC128238843 isoform X2 [Mya arenaria]|uniref:uncharacterized protein LOC128238843 isoform X2 n=1 Tax=Mya arenaria TaxID=6604 RepID=UPI0022E781A9|nr:uncharacterized protein LOC128238843 isoform X2 [Mya arenaria]